MTPNSAYRADLRAGARAMAPWLFSLAPFGLVIGVTAARANLPTLAGWLTGPLIYAGSAQVATIQMLDAGAAPAAVVITALMINLRLMFYSAAMAPHWRGTPMWWRLLCGYLLVDPSFTVGVERYAQVADRRRAHAQYLGSAVALWLVWLASIAVGAMLAARVPAWSHLELLVPLYMVGAIIPRLRRTANRRPTLVAAATALACLALPMHLGIAIGILAAMIFAAGRRPRPRQATR